MESGNTVALKAPMNDILSFLDTAHFVDDLTLTFVLNDERWLNSSVDLHIQYMMRTRHGELSFYCRRFNGSIFVFFLRQGVNGGE